MGFPMILFENSKIVCILTGYGVATENSKTGHMLQTWILVKNKHPVEAIKDGSDAAICGNCPHRGKDGFIGRSCYVDVVTGGPSAVWRKYQAGGYDTITWIKKNGELIPDEEGCAFFEENVEGIPIRFGSYGDPAFVPLTVWLTLLEYASGNTGYTHQWRNPANQLYKQFLMASCDSESDLFEAQSMGWRTFRVRTKDAPILPVEIVCPASEEAGKRRTCSTCKACSGDGSGKSVSIIAHGKFARNFVGDLVVLG